MAKNTNINSFVLFPIFIFVTLALAVIGLPGISQQTVYAADAEWSGDTVVYNGLDLELVGEMPPNANNGLDGTIKEGSVIYMYLGKEVDPGAPGGVAPVYHFVYFEPGVPPSMARSAKYVSARVDGDGKYVPNKNSQKNITVTPKVASPTPEPDTTGDCPSGTNACGPNGSLPDPKPSSGCRADTPENCAPGETPAGGDADAGAEVEEKCDPSKETCCDKVKTSIITGDDICGTADDDGGIIFGLLKWVLRIMTAGVGIAAVGGIAYGALLYSSAENKPEQTKKAIGIITNVVIGILAYALMYVLLNYLIPGGVFL